MNDGRARWADAGRAGARARRRGADRRWTVVDGQREGVARDGRREARARPDVDDARRGVARGSGAVRARAVDDGRVDAHGRISSRLVSTAGTSETRARERATDGNAIRVGTTRAGDRKMVRRDGHDAREGGHHVPGRKV